MDFYDYTVGRRLEELSKKTLADTVSFKQEEKLKAAHTQVKSMAKTIEELEHKLRDANEALDKVERFLNSSLNFKFWEMYHTGICINKAIKLIEQHKKEVEDE